MFSTSPPTQSFQSSHNDVIETADLEVVDETSCASVYFDGVTAWKLSMNGENHAIIDALILNPITSEQRIVAIETALLKPITD